MKIANKISLSFLGVAVVLTAVAGFTFLKISENILKKEIMAHLETTARSRKDHVETYLELIKGATAQLANSPTLENFLLTPKGDPGWKKITDLTMERLKRTKDANPAIYEFLLMDTSGIVVASSNPTSVGQNRSADTIFTEGRKEAYIKDAYYSDIYNIPLIAVSVPVIEYGTGKVIGVLASRNTLKDLDSITIDTTGLGRTGEIYIVNKDGYAITPLRGMKDTFLKQRVDTENYKLCMRRRGESEKSLEVIVCPDYRGIMVLGTNAYIIEMHWALLAEVDVREAYVPLARLRAVVLVVIALVI